MIVFIHHSVNPYRVAFFNKLGETKIPFKVYFLSRPARNRKWKVDDYKLNFLYEFIDGWKFYIPGNDHSYFQLNKGVWTRLKQDKPSSIITIGWNYLATYIALLYAKLYKKKFIVWSESTKNESSWRRALTLPLIKMLVWLSDGYIAAGTRAKDYLVSLGAKPKKINIAYYTIDTEEFIKQAEKYQSKGTDVRKKYRIANKQKIVLFVGQYIKRKGVYQLLEVANELKSNNNVLFLFVGYGTESEKMKRYVEKHELENVIIAGFVRNEEIMRYFLSCEIFILPSLEETWGLVVNEAMCAEKPVLVSKFAGSSADLVQDGVNGFVIDPSNPMDIKNKILKLVQDGKLRSQFGKRSLEIIKPINLEQNVEVINRLYESS